MCLVQVALQVVDATRPLHYLKQWSDKNEQRTMSVGAQLPFARTRLATASYDKITLICYNRPRSVHAATRFGAHMHAVIPVPIENKFP